MSTSNKRTSARSTRTSAASSPRSCTHWQRDQRGASHGGAANSGRQREATRKALTEQLVNGNSKGKKKVADPKRPASPNGELSAAKRRKPSNPDDENVRPISDTRAQSRTRRRRAPEEIPLPSDSDDDEPRLDADDDDRRSRCSYEDEQEYVEGDDGDDNVDPGATTAYMLESETEQVQEPGDAEMVVTSNVMSARERARRDEEPHFDDDDGDDAGGSPHTGPAFPAPASGTPSPASGPQPSAPTLHPNLTQGVPAPGLPAALPPIPPQAPATHSATPAPGYHPSTWLVQEYPNQRVLSLKIQTPKVQAVLKCTFEKVIGYTLFVDGMPDPSTLSLLYQQMLVEAAEELQADDIRERLLNDPTYSARFDPMITNRVTVFRSAFKRKAVDKVTGFYSLPEDDPAALASAVHNLLEQASFHYARKDNGAFDATKPYSHRCVLSVIQDVVFNGPGRRSYARKFHDKFFDMNPDNGDPELPIAMVALAATAVVAALDDRKNGSSMEFSYDKVSNVYKDHAQSLAALRASKAPVFHRIVSDLFKKVSGSKVYSATGGRSVALALLDVDSIAV